MPDPERPVPSVAPFTVLFLVVGGCCVSSNLCVISGGITELAAPTTVAEGSDPASSILSALVCMTPALALVGWALGDVRRTRRHRRLVALLEAEPHANTARIAEVFGVGQVDAAQLRDEAVARNYLPERDASHPTSTATNAPVTRPAPHPVPRTAPVETPVDVAEPVFTRPALPMNPPPLEAFPAPPPPIVAPPPVTYGAWVGRCDFCKHELFQDHEPTYRQKCPDCRAPLRFSRT